MNRLKEEFYKNWLEIKIGTPKFNGKTLADDIWNWINQNYISKEQVSEKIDNYFQTKRFDCTDDIGRDMAFFVVKTIKKEITNLINKKDDIFDNY